MISRLIGRAVQSALKYTKLGRISKKRPPHLNREGPTAIHAWQTVGEGRRAIPIAESATFKPHTAVFDMATDASSFAMCSPSTVRFSPPS